MPKSLNIFAAVAVTALSLSLAVEPAKAAVINWGAAQNITGSSDVVTTGTLHASANFWSTGTAAGSGNITVNGVQFDGFQSARSSPTSVPGPTSLTVGNITLTGTSPETNNQNLQGFADVGGPASYNNLLNQLAYVVNTSTTGTMGVNVGGLTNGAQYLIQFWVNDSRLSAATRTVLVGGNSLAVNTTGTAGGLGQYITGTFTADSTTQSFPSIGGVGSVAYANAMQVRMLAVPEPTQMVSVAAIGAALGMWRMRKLRRNGSGSNTTAC